MKKITAILTAAILLAAMLAAYCADQGRREKRRGSYGYTDREPDSRRHHRPLEIPTQTEAARRTALRRAAGNSRGAGGHDPGTGARRNAQHRSSRRIQDDICRADGEAR